MTRRTNWYAKDFIIKDEPLMKSLLAYRQKNNRIRTKGTTKMPNLVSSITDDGRQMPILDLDFPHRIVPSSTPGHNHLYLDIPMSQWKWFWLMWGLWQAGVIELGFFVWSIRRGGNFVRIPGTVKDTTNPAENTKPTYGWLFKMKAQPHHHGGGIPCPIPRCGGDIVEFE